MKADISLVDSAFKHVLIEIERLRERLNRAGATAFGAGDYTRVDAMRQSAEAAAAAHAEVATLRLCTMTLGHKLAQVEATGIRPETEPAPRQPTLPDIEAQAREKRETTATSTGQALRVTGLTGIKPEAVDTLYKAMIRRRNRDRLAVCLYFMSDLPPQQSHLADIEANLRLIFPPSVPRQLRPKEYEDFQASAIRFLLNSDETKLWQSYGDGLRKNSHRGNVLAQRILSESGIVVLIDD